MPADVPGSESAAAATREAAIAATQRVKIDTPSISGSINLTGGRIDDVKLKHYRLTVDKDSPEIELLNPSALPNGQYAELGFVGNEATGAMPGPDTVWKAEGNQALTPSTPVTLSYINPTGLDLHAHDLDRPRLHVQGFRHRQEHRHRGGLAVQLRPRHALRQADDRQRLRAA